MPSRHNAITPLCFAQWYSSSYSEAVNGSGKFNAVPKRADFVKETNVF